MKLTENWSIQTKLTVIILLVTGVAVGSGFLYVTLTGVFGFKKELVRQTVTQARMIAATCAESVASGDTADVNGIISKLDVTPAIVGGFVYDQSGRLMSVYNPQGRDNIPWTLPEEKREHYYQGGEVNILHVFSEITQDDRPVGTIYLWASGYELKYILERYLKSMIVMLSALILISYLLARRFQRYISEPISDLSRVAKEISSKPDIDIRAKKRSADEIGSLVDSFNDMLDHLHQRELMQRAAEEQVRQSLEEKEILLKEIHHRVKNNMQVIVSLLNLQAEHLKDQAAADMLKDSRSRIRAMALVHEKLYQSQDLGKINFSEYIDSLAEELRRIYFVPKHQLQLDLPAMDLAISIDRAVPAGLILNELLTNAFKYGFPEGFEAGNGVRIELKPDGEWVQMTVADSGPGFSGDVSLQKTESLGLTLVRTLTERQLGGSVSIEQEQGLTVRTRFSLAG